MRTTPYICSDAIPGDAGARNGSSLVRLRGWLDGHVTDATLASAARAVARSRRSLQRDLHLAGTTFRAELLDARVRQAKRLLLHTETSLTEIAHDVGCASLQHFSIMFRTHTGEPPSQWRAHQRDLLGPTASSPSPGPRPTSRANRST